MLHPSLFLLLVLLVGFWLYLLLRRDPRINRYVSQFQGPPGYPIVGNALSFLRPHEEYFSLMDEWVKEYGRVFKVWIGNFLPFIGLSDADIIEKVLSSSVHIEKGKSYSLLHNWLGFGLLTAPGKRWLPRRKLLAPSFHFKILETFMPVFNEQASVLVDCLSVEAERGEEFDISHYISKCTLDIICGEGNAFKYHHAKSHGPIFTCVYAVKVESAMGKRMHAQTSLENREYIEAVNGMCELLLTKLVAPWYRLPVIKHISPLARAEKRNLRILKGFCDDIIQARILERLGRTSTNSADKKEQAKLHGRIRRQAFLDILLEAEENGKGLSHGDILDEVETFIFEGHDTTAMSLLWTLLMLSHHTECQKLVQEELDQIFANAPERDVTSADLPKMKYLECCIKESLRLYPSVPFIMRQIETDIDLDDGKVIPNGATVMIAIYYLHRDPQYFPSPFKFKPERFTVENSVGRHPYAYAYIPFSAGPRNCIGQKFALMEEKVVLAKILRSYNIVGVGCRENVRPSPDVVLRPKGIKLRLSTRT